MEEEHKKEPFNDLIFKELIKRGYALEGNTRVWNLADSKLWYITDEQAQAFLDLEESEDYQKNVIQVEIDLINKNMDSIIKKTGEEALNIIDLGCGDGKKAVLFIEKLKGERQLRYCPIDISDYMVEKALRKVSVLDVDQAVGFQWNISDFENIENISSLLRKQGVKKNFFLLLGNTLGNFEINELLYGVKSAMKKGDLLLIGNGLDSRNSEDIIKAYDNEHLDNLLIKTLTQIGLKKENLQYGARFRNSRIEMYYTIKNNCEISFLDKKVPFSVGDQIVVAVSYKYNKKAFEDYLKLYFKDEKIFTSEDEAYGLALCGL